MMPAMCSRKTICSARFVVLLLAAVLVACGKSAAPPAPAEKARPVVVVEAVIGEVRADVTAPAQAHPVQEAWLTAEVGGRVLRVAREGVFVRRGEVVLEVDAERAGAARDAARARRLRSEEELTHRRRLLDRMEKLAAEGAVSREERDAAASAAAMAEAALEADRATERDLVTAAARQRVTAPFDGWVLERLVEAGEIIGPATRAIRIGDIGTLELVARLSEADALRVSVGDSATLRFEARPDAEHRASVARIDRALDPVTRTAGVVLRLPNHDSALPAGLMARVAIRAETRSGVLVVPSEAVLDGPEGRFAWVSVGDRAERRMVRTGLMGGGLVEVLEGLSAGDLVVTRGEETLSPGVLLAPTRAEAPTRSEPEVLERTPAAMPAPVSGGVSDSGPRPGSRPAPNPGSRPAPSPAPRADRL